MRVLVVIFGGLDHEFLDRFGCKSLRQKEWGKVVVDELHDQRDVATQITAQLITGRTWRENGVADRKTRTLHYHNDRVRWLEERVLRGVDKGRRKREDIYQAMRWVHITQREYQRQDLRCPSLFDEIENSRAVYVPGYNPEPSWSLDRNILDPVLYPELGVEGALDLREKNFQWRRRRFMEALDEGPYDLLMAQFQYIDSTQHLYLTYTDPPDMVAVEDAYWRMDELAKEIQERAESRYDRILFVSDNGAAVTEGGTRPTHHNRPFYSCDAELGLDDPNLRDFHEHILRWVGEPTTRGV